MATHRYLLYRSDSLCWEVRFGHRNDVAYSKVCHGAHNQRLSVDYIYGWLLLFHAKATEWIWKKFGTHDSLKSRITYLGDILPWYSYRILTYSGETWGAYICKTPAASIGPYMPHDRIALSTCVFFSSFYRFLSPITLAHFS